MAEFSFSFIQLFFKLLARQTGQIGKIDFIPQKPHFRGEPVEQPFPRESPESQGVESTHIREYLEALKGSPDANIHQAIVIRHGKIITECSFSPYQRGMWHITHSMCKTFTGLAAGLAIQEGLFGLDESIDDIFPDKIRLLSRIGRKKVTIRHLLTMTSGVEYSEAGAIESSDWCANFMSAGCKFEPGTRFEYNSMNSFMISAAIQERSGITMFQFLKTRLFDPMGIREIFWEESPRGYTKGGWGCFIRPEDACKIGQLMLNKGLWNGQQLVPAYWIESMTSRQVENDKFGYGYQCWMEQRPGGFAMNGLFGQDVICYPDDDMILMVNSGNRELLQEGSLTEILRKFWGVSYHPSPVPLRENPRELKKLEEQIALYSGHDTYGGSGLGSAVLEDAVNRNLAQLPPDFKKVRRARKGWGLWAPKSTVMSPQEMLGILKNHTFQMENGRTGVFPLICQVVHNNYTDGIKKIGFADVNGTMNVLLYEGEEIHPVKVGFAEPEISEISIHGEPYYIGTTGRIATDEYDRVVLLLTISFLEEACCRKINLYFDGEDIEVRYCETPGDAVIADALAYTGDSQEVFRLPIIRQILEQGGKDFLDVSIQGTVNPTDRGHLIRSGKNTNDMP